MNKDKNKSSKKVSPIFWIFLVLVFLTSFLDETDASDEIIGYVVIALLVCLVVFVISTVKKQGTKSVHSHDRISGKSNIYKPDDCKGIEHWIKQLDGFLACGIIDRKEYSVLVKSYREQYNENGDYIY